MGSAEQQASHMPRRALLTDREKEILRGDVDAADFEDFEAYQQKIKSRLRHRITKLEADLEVLDAAAPEIADDIRESICGQPVGRLERLEKEVEQLREDSDA